MRTSLVSALQRFAGRLNRSQLPLAACVYALLACLLFWPVAPLDNSHVVTCGCYDIAAQTWYMAWAPHALLSGTNPFFTNALNVPFGVNMAANTGMPLLGIVTTPITWLFGPFASFNVLLRLAFCLSAFSMFFVLRRFVRWPVAAFLGGLIYGFSPYVVAQSSLHLNLSFVAVPPLMLLVLDEIVIRRTWTARRSGLILGFLAVAQYLITAEVLVDVVLVVGVASVLLIARYPNQAWESRRYLVTVLGWSLLPFVVICGYPILFELAGPQHLNFSPGVIYGFNTYRADLLSPFVPTSHQILGSTRWKAAADSWVNATSDENGIFLGIPSVALLLLTTVVVRRAFVRVMACVVAVSFLFALGSRLVVDGHPTGIWMPFSLLLHISVLQIEVPARYALLSDLGVAAVIAIGVDHFYGVFQFTRSAKGFTAISPKRPTRQWVGFAAVAVLVVASIAILTPKVPVASVQTNIPKYFATSAVEQIPRDSTVLAYPYPIQRSNFAMAWQVEAGFRFNLIGDYAFTPLQSVAPPGGGVGGGLLPPTLDPTFVENFFELAFNGPAKGDILPRPSAPAFSTTRDFLARYHVETILVDQLGQDPRTVSSFFTRMFHTAPRRYGSLDVWYSVQRLIHQKGFNR